MENQIHHCHKNIYFIIVSPGCHRVKGELWPAATRPVVITCDYVPGALTINTLTAKDMLADLTNKTHTNSAYNARESKTLSIIYIQISRSVLYSWNKIIGVISTVSEALLGWIKVNNISTPPLQGCRAGWLVDLCCNSHAVVTACLSRWKTILISAALIRLTLETWNWRLRWKTSRFHPLSLRSALQGEIDFFSLPVIS